MMLLCLNSIIMMMRMRIKKLKQIIGKLVYLRPTKREIRENEELSNDFVKLYVNFVCMCKKWNKCLLLIAVKL